MRIVLWVKGERGRACLDALVAARRAPVLVVGQSQSGHAEPPEFAAARAHGIAHVVIDDPAAPRALAQLRELAPDAFVLAGYGRILGREAIAIPSRLCCNLHGGALPAYRGSSPLNWALINGCTSFTLSIIEVAPGIDAGAIYAERSFPIAPDDTIADLHDAANEAFPAMLLEVIAAAEDGALAGRPQTGPAAYHPRRFPDDGLIVWDLMTAQAVHDLVRALTEPYPGAYTYTADGRELRVLAAARLEPPFRGEPGRVYRVDARGAVVTASDRALRLTRVVDSASGADALPSLVRYERLATVRGSVAASFARSAAGFSPRIGIIVQARLSSRRLPGKVLRPIGGRPMLALLLERLERVAGRDDIVVATSVEADDDALAAWCAAHDVVCFRGSLDDVAGRMLAAARAHGFDALVRVCADSPFLDPALVRRAVDAYRAHAPDLVTNLFPRRAWPRGQSVEVIRRAALERTYDEMDGPGDREHVTPYFYRHPDRFHLLPLEASVDHSEARLVVDTAEDLAEAERIVARAPRPIRDCTLDELLELRALLR